MTLPPKLKQNDEIRIVAPARQATIVGEQTIDSAKKRLEDMGYRVSFGKNIFSDGIVSGSVESRVEDLHDAFKDPKVKAIFSVIGGFNSNELLPYLDYDLIKNNPKIILGYSDITALQNAIYARTGLVTYSGPHFSSFGEKLGFDYSQEYFNKAVVEGGVYSVLPSKQWSSDRWYKDQDNRNFVDNPGYTVIQEGVAEGTVVGGNMCTFDLLQGTPFMPSLKNSVIFLEEDQMGLMHIGLFIRNLASLVQQPDFDSVKAVVFGRFHPECDIDEERFEEIVRSEPKLSSIPIISGVDFGHTDPRITFPIGGQVKISASKRSGVSIEFTEH